MTVAYVVYLLYLFRQLYQTFWPSFQWQYLSLLPSVIFLFTISDSVIKWFLPSLSEYFLPFLNPSVREKVILLGEEWGGIRGEGGKWLDISPPLSCPSGAPPLPPPPLSPPLHLPWDQRYLKVSKIKHYGDSITRKCAPYSVWTNVLPMAGSGAQVFKKKKKF